MFVVNLDNIILIGFLHIVTLAMDLTLITHAAMRFVFVVVIIRHLSFLITCYSSSIVGGFLASAVLILVNVMLERKHFVIVFFIVELLMVLEILFKLCITFNLLFQ